MDKYTNVNVDKLANIYFEGNVISRNIFLEDGSRKTLGVMLPGKYEFNTDARELMEIISGKLTLKLQNHDDWKLVICGEGPDRKKIQDLIAEKKLYGNVLLKGYLNS